MTISSLPLKPFYFLRHGETDWNRQRIYQGQTDIPLNEEGIRQAHAAKAFVRNEPIARLVSSPLKRAKKTAQIINEALCVDHILHDGLQEGHLGVLVKQVVTDAFKCKVDRWVEGKERIEGAEDYQDFIYRVVTAVSETLLSQEGIPLFIAHGGVFRVLSRVMGHRSPFKAQNAELILCDPPSQPQVMAWRIVRINGEEEFETPDL